MLQSAAPATDSGGVPGWAVAAVLLACLVPLALTPVLPLVDFYAHVARYYVLARIDTVPALEENYTAAWKLLPNLGLDVIGTALMEILPPRKVSKIVAGLVILAPAVGVFTLSATLHGRVTAPALWLGAGLAFSHILFWGFANFLLGLGLGMAGLALWIALRHRPGWQLGLALLFAVVLFFVHGLAFAFWGLFLGCVEVMLAAEDGDLRRPRALARRMARLASLAVLPALLFVQMPTAGADGGLTPALANLREHVQAGVGWTRILEEIVTRLDTFLRAVETGHPWIDRGLGAILWGGLGLGLATGALRLDRRLWLACGLAGMLIVIMPPSMFGVGYLDDRAPLMLLALMAAGLSLPPDHRWAARAAALLAGLFVLRIALLSGGWAIDGQVYRAYLTALETNDTGALGMPELLGGTGERDPPGTPCKPLSFLMLLENDTAVRTFAFGTQQPLEIQGMLAQPRDRLGLAEVGYTALVTCTDNGSSPPPPPDFVRAATYPPWTLYVRRP